MFYLNDHPSSKIGNKNGKIMYYIKAEEPSYGDWFIFQAPQGIYLAQSTGDENELENIFNGYYRVQI